MTTHDDANPTGANPADAAPPARHSYLSTAGVLVAVLMTVAAVCFLGLRWFRVQFPDAAIVAQGDPSVEGIDVSVWTAAGDPAPGTRQLLDGGPAGPGRLRAANDHSVVVLVHEGEYVLRASIDGRAIYERRVIVPSNRGVFVQIVVPPELRPKTRPATVPSTPRAAAAPSESS